MALKVLYLIRHSKAVSSHPDGDEYRGLSAEGLQRVDALLPQLEERGFSVDLVLCSPYRRTLQTRDRLQRLVGGVRTEISTALTPDVGVETALSELLRWEGQGFERIAVVTHNPLVTHLAERLLIPVSVPHLVFHTPTVLALEWEQGIKPFRGRPSWILHP